MSDESVLYYANKLNQLAINLPNNDELTKDGYVEYQLGMDCMLAYRGHYEDLDKATLHFAECGVRPYSFAGFAMVMEAASYRSGDEYNMDGIAHAMKFWKRARMIQTDRLEIDYVGTRLYGQLEQPRAIREILDKYKQSHNKNFWYCLAEANYWNDKEKKRSKYWLDRANKAAGKHRLRKLYLLNLNASSEMSKPKYGDAIRLYRQIVKLNPQDPWAWHNLSFMYINLGRVEEADECNQRALSIMDFGAARQIESSIRFSREHPTLDKVIGKIVDMKRLFGGR